MNKRKIIPTRKSNEPEFSLTGFFGKDVFESGAELFDYLNKPVFKYKETGVSHRNLNWWVTEKVLEKPKGEINRFTFTEFVWIKIVEQMRLFSVPLPYLAGLKEKLFATVQLRGLPTHKEQTKDYIEKLNLKPEEKQKLLTLLRSETSLLKHDTGINKLQLLIVDSILNRKPLGFAFFSDGYYIVTDKSKENLYNPSDLALLNTGLYINVSVSKILSEFLRTDLAFEVVPKINLLTYPENKLYEVIKTGEYESIVIHFKDRKIKALELRKNANVQKKIVDILSEGNFAEIIVKKHKGVVTKIEQNIKIAF